MIENNKKLLIHDLDEAKFINIFPKIEENIEVISKNNKINKCIGCFGCWIKTPATCVIKDSYNEMGKLISKVDEVIIISECFYGGYSHFVKNVIDRSLSYVHPYFTIRNNEMHHRYRYKHQIKFSVYFYGENITIEEKNTCEKLVKANGLNLNSIENSISFYKAIDNMRGETL